MNGWQDEGIRHDEPLIPLVDLKEATLDRRDFIRRMGAGMALASLGSACVRRPDERIFAHVVQPPEGLPGVSQYYATAMSLDGYGTGLLVEARDGRPLKVEGNPHHPASLGAAGIFEQGSLLDLYDSDRLFEVRHAGYRSSWTAFRQDFVRPLQEGAAGARGAGLHVLLEPTSSLLVADCIARLRERFPAVHTHFYAPLSSRSAIGGSEIAFGAQLVPRYAFHNAQTIVALDSDFLAAGPFHLRYARDFATGRRLTPSGTMSRLYVTESALSSTGAMADHRLAARPSHVRGITLALAAEVLTRRGRAASFQNTVQRDLSERHNAWVRAAASDLLAHAGRCVVVAGERQPVWVHALSAILNDALGNVGSTVTYASSPLLEAGRSDDIVGVADALRSGDVAALLILGGNPSYAAAAELELPRLIRDVPRCAYLGAYAAETAQDCAWALPESHYMETWGDTRAYDGTVALVQPLIAALGDGRSVAEVLVQLADVAPARAFDLLRDFWRTRRRAGAVDFETFWRESLSRGVVDGTAIVPASVRARSDALGAALQQAQEDTSPEAIELVLKPNPSLHDGRFSNNAWLQELPDPITKLTWGNAALLSPKTAQRHGVRTGQSVELQRNGRTVQTLVMIVPGQADETVVLNHGYGRRFAALTAAASVGVDAFQLAAAAASSTLGVSMRAAPGASPDTLAVTQDHWRLEGRDIVLAGSADSYEQLTERAARHRGPVASLYEPYPYASGDQWAMVIDLSLCTGCSACVVACQAENNVPTVGPADVRKGREMHWLRIDRYVEERDEDVHVVHQPMLCQHCEKAPCEYVCPVNATVHSPDGLNEMVYNRCVGTRFCSNNCPYKVRRFNWFDYNDELDAIEQMVKNPDVTVRERGVMEKCTFCVQRIRRAQIDAQIAGASATPEVVTACQQACPTRAITFGSLNNANSPIQPLLNDPRRYSVLHERGTQPRVHYLARLTNPSAMLQDGRR